MLIQLNSAGDGRASSKEPRMKSPSRKTEAVITQHSLHQASTAAQSQKVINACKLVAHKFHDYPKGVGDERINSEAPNPLRRSSLGSAQWSIRSISSPKSPSSNRKYLPQPAIINDKDLRKPKRAAKDHEKPSSSGMEDSRPLSFAERVTINSKQPNINSSTSPSKMRASLLTPSSAPGQ